MLWVSPVWRTESLHILNTLTSNAEIVRIIQLTILGNGGAHNNRTLAKLSPDLQARITQVVDMCAKPRPDSIVEMRPDMDKALKAYRTVIDEDTEG